MSEALKIELEDELEEIAVLDDASAEMVLQRLRDAEEQYLKMKDWYEYQIRKYKDARDRTQAWAESCLRPYMEMVPTTGKKIRSYEMPGATLKLSKQDPEYSIKDAELVPWLKANNLERMVAVKEEARWGDLKDTLKDEKGKIRMVEAGDGTLQVVTADGEVIPGVTATARNDKFTIKLK